MSSSSRPSSPGSTPSRRSSASTCSSCRAGAVPSDPTIKLWSYPLKRASGPPSGAPQGNSQGKPEKTGGEFMAKIDETRSTYSVQAVDNGLAIERRFTKPGVHPFEAIEWDRRDARIGDPSKPAFEQLDVEFPKSWSQNATNIVAQKYFRGKLGTPQRERSVKQMVSRVAGTIAGWGRDGGYFASDE